MENGPARSLLLALAEAGEVCLAPEQQADLQALLGMGLVRPADPPGHDPYESRFDQFQGRHRQLLKAKALVLRLQERTAPRSGLGKWLPGGLPRLPGAEDPDLLALHRMLSETGIEVREVERPLDLLGRLKHVLDRVLVEDRECLDRMADLDRELDSARKLGAEAVRVEPFGWVELTAAGERELPEWGALQDLDATFNLVSGPRRQKIDDYTLFRHDPANLLACLLENPGGHAQLSESVFGFEAMADTLDRLSGAAGLRSTRIRNAYLIRLLRMFRKDPKAPYVFLQRERIRRLAEEAQPFLPPSMLQEGWPLVYGLDVLVAGRAEFDGPARIRQLEAILAALAGAFPGLSARDGQGIRLAFALLHAQMDRNVAAPQMAERFLSVQLAATQLGCQAAPMDLREEGARLIFGYHLAHLAEFVQSRIPDQVNRFQRLEAALGDRGRVRSTPIQVLLHGLLCLERLGRLGLDLSPEEYAGTYQRVRHRIATHKDLARAFRTEHGRLEDEALLAANLTARACFQGLVPTPGAKPLPDVGVAAAYEGPDRTVAPLVGQPFGTLMLQ